MISEEIDQRASLIAAYRLGRMLFWMKMRGESIPDSVIQEIARRRIYQVWGYPSLGACLLKECGLTVSQAEPYVIQAIKEGHDYADNYRNSNTRSVHAGAVEKHCVGQSEQCGVLEKHGQIALS